MRLLALTVGGNGQPASYNISLPPQIGAFANISISRLLSNAMTFAVVFTIVLAFIFLIVGGARWIMSGGDKKQLDTAQRTLTYVIIGLIVLLLSFLIINVIGNISGVNLLKNNSLL